MEQSERKLVERDKYKKTASKYDFVKVRRLSANLSGSCNYASESLSHVCRCLQAASRYITCTLSSKLRPAGVHSIQRRRSGCGSTDVIQEASTTMCCPGTSRAGCLRSPGFRRRRCALQYHLERNSDCVKLDFFELKPKPAAGNRNSTRSEEGAGRP